MLQTSTPRRCFCFCHLAPATAFGTSVFLTDNDMDLLFSYQRRGILGMKSFKAGVYQTVVLRTEDYSTSIQELLKTSEWLRTKQNLLCFWLCQRLFVQHTHTKSLCPTPPRSTGCVTHLGTPTCNKRSAACGSRDPCETPGTHLSRVAAVAHLPQSTRTTPLGQAEMLIYIHLIIQ